jgi:hypothetical protein
MEEARKAIDGALDAVFGDAPEPAPASKPAAETKRQHAARPAGDILSIPALDLDTDFDVN